MSAHTCAAAEVSKAVHAPTSVDDNFDTRRSSVTKNAPINPDDDMEPLPQEQLKGGGCAPCCVIQ